MRGELEQYGGGLADKPEIIALNKCDAMTPRQISDRRKQLHEASGAPVFVISGATRQGVPELLEALWKVIQEARQK